MEPQDGSCINVGSWVGCTLGEKTNFWWSPNWLWPIANLGSTWVKKGHPKNPIGKRKNRLKPVECRNLLKSKEIPKSPQNPKKSPNNPKKSPRVFFLTQSQIAEGLPRQATPLRPNKKTTEKGTQQKHSLGLQIPQSTFLEGILKTQTLGLRTKKESIPQKVL